MYKDLRLFNTDILTPDELNKKEKITSNDNIMDSQIVTDDIREEDIEEQYTDNLQNDIQKNNLPPTQNKLIEKIVIFYSNKTFSEYKLEK